MTKAKKSKFCKVKDCKRYAKRKNYCQAHYKQIERSGHITRTKPFPAISCKTPNCPYWAEIKGYCFLCDHLRRARGQTVDPVKSRRRSLKYKYNISPEIYDSILQAQGNVCAICKQQEITRDSRTGKIRRLAIDHDHKTGKIRGLLCSNCNRMLGSALDNTNILAFAISYLQKFENNQQ